MDLLLTQNQLSQIIPNNHYIDQWYSSLTKCLPDYDITSIKRLSAFLSQCAHESGDFVNIKENLNYKSQGLMSTWPKLFPTIDIANQYALNPEMIANRAYANILGNGDEKSGDGYKFCGRGLIQITGKCNYQDFADSVSMNVDDVPSFLETFDGAVQSACWFWETHKLNSYADNSDIEGMTKIINGGTLGLDDRISRYYKTITILGGQSNG